MIQLTTLLTTLFFTLLLATDPRLLDRNLDRTLFRRMGDSDLEIMECGHLPVNPSPTAIPLQPGMQLVGCRPAQRDSSGSMPSKTDDDDPQLDIDPPSSQSTSTFSKTDNDRSDSYDLLSLRFPSELASSTQSKSNDEDLLPPNPYQRESIRTINDDELQPDPDAASLRSNSNLSYPRPDDDGALPDPYQRESIRTINDDDLQPDPDAPSLRSSSSHSSPNDDLPGPSQSQPQRPYYPAIINSSAQPFGSEIEFTTSPRLGYGIIGSPAPGQINSSTTQLTAPQQECMQCAQECAGPEGTPQRAVAATCPHGPRTQQSDFCSGRRIACTISAVTCCAFLTVFLSVYEQT